MDDVIGMEIREGVKDLGSERLGHLRVEPAMFFQTTPDGPARDVFQESVILQRGYLRQGIK